MDAKILSVVKLKTDDYQKMIAPLKVSDKKLRSERYVTLIEKIKHARFEEEEFLPQGVWKRDYKKADWDVVCDLCIESLKEYSKDLQILGWLTEAWLKTYGIQGAYAGMTLMGEIVEAHWTDLQPPLDGEDDEYRQVSVNWLNDRLSELIKFTPISHSEAPLVNDYTFADWELSVYYDRLSKKSAASRKQLSQAKPLYAKLEDIESAILQTPYSYHHMIKEQFELLLESIQIFEENWKKKAPKTIGLFKKSRETIQNILNFADTKLLKRPSSNRATGKEGNEFETSSDTSVQTQASIVSPNTGYKTYSFSNETEAYQVLLEIARYLGEKHPHSPAPFLIQQAVEMGQLTFIEVMKRFSSDPTLNALFDKKIESIKETQKN